MKDSEKELNDMLAYYHFYNIDAYSNESFTEFVLKYFEEEMVIMVRDRINKLRLENKEEHIR